MAASSASNRAPAGAPTDPTGPTGRLCEWLAGFRLDQAPASARERARLLTLDGIGCAIVGAQLPWSRTAVDIVRKLEGTGDRSIVGWGATTSAPGAALLNGTFIQGFELDDFHPLGPLHSASLVLPALWAAAEGSATPVSGRAFLEAAMAGYEVGPRVGMALHGVEMLSRGWHSGAVFGTHAAAAAVGKLMGLDAARFEDALGLAGTQSAGLMAAQYEAMCKRMHHGFSARNGLYAAVLAEGGYTGIKRVFERPNPIDYRPTRFDKDWASDGSLGDVAVQGIGNAMKKLLPKSKHQPAVARPPPDVRFNPGLHERPGDLGSEATGDAYKAAPIAFEKAPGLDGEASRRIRRAIGELEQRRAACPAAQRRVLLQPVLDNLDALQRVENAMAKGADPIQAQQTLPRAADSAYDLARRALWYADRKLAVCAP